MIFAQLYLIRVTSLWHLSLLCHYITWPELTASCFPIETSRTESSAQFNRSAINASTYEHFIDFKLSTSFWSKQIKERTMASRVFLVSVMFLLILWHDAEAWRRRRRRRCGAQNCAVSGWSSWSTCSYQCGVGGTQVRTRRVTRAASCGGSCYPLRETRKCNTGCPNGATVAVGRCICRRGFRGKCCDGGESQGSVKVSTRQQR